MHKSNEVLELDWGSNDIQKVTKLISSAPDLETAYRIFASHLNHMKLTLISVMISDLKGEHSSIRPYREIPKRLAALSTQFKKVGGCPITKEAKRLRKPFDALQINKKFYPGFLEQRFLDELTKLGHHHVLVFPIVLGRGLSIIVIGTGDRSVSVEFQTELFASVGQSFSATVTRFPEIMKLFETKKLTTLQAKVLFMTSIGMSKADIGKSLDYSQNTISIIVEVAKKNLSANSTPHAIAKAFALGEFSNMNISESDVL